MAIRVGTLRDGRCGRVTAPAMIVRILAATTAMEVDDLQNEATSHALRDDWSHAECEAVRIAAQGKKTALVEIGSPEARDYLEMFDTDD